VNGSNLPNLLGSCKKAGKSNRRQGKGKKVRTERGWGGCCGCNRGSGCKLRVEIAVLIRLKGFSKVK